MTSLITLVTVVQWTAVITAAFLLWACIDAALRHQKSDSIRSKSIAPEERGIECATEVRGT